VDKTRLGEQMPCEAVSCERSALLENTMEVSIKSAPICKGIEPLRSGFEEIRMVFSEEHSPN
jgi:hypothetical protein